MKILSPTVSLFEPRPSCKEHASSSASQDDPTMVTDFPSSISLFNPSLVSLSLHPRRAISFHACGSTNPLGGNLGMDPNASRHLPNAISSDFGFAGFAGCSTRGVPTDSGCFPSTPVGGSPPSGAAAPVLDPVITFLVSTNSPRSGSRDIARVPRRNSTFAVFGSCAGGGGSGPSDRASTTSTCAAGSRSSRARRAA